MVRRRRVRRLLLGVVIVGLLGSASLLVGCDVPRATVQEILHRTIPAGDAMPGLSGAVSSGSSIQFTWEFDTHLATNDYATWLRAHLDDFQVAPLDGARLGLAKLIGGDSYRLS